MTYTVCRIQHPSGQVAHLDSFGTEDAAKMCLANVVEEALADRSDLSRVEVREMVDEAVRDMRFVLNGPDGQRVSYFYIDKE